MSRVMFRTRKCLTLRLRTLSAGRGGELSFGWDVCAASQLMNHPPFTLIVCPVM
jgi:hypothetical protein